MTKRIAKADARAYAAGPGPERKTLYVRIGKRLVDAALAGIGLAITSPVFLFCAVAIRFTSPGPIFFRQIRIGQLGTPFSILKFRSMIPSRTGLTLTTAGDQRVTPLGKVLRKTKIDELPQLINVLFGDMSLVGPRPEVPEYADAYTPLQRKVLEVRPGLTGVASLRLVNEEQILAGSPDPEKFYQAELLPYKLALELPYCEDVRFWTDMKLIALTVARLLSPRLGL